MMIKKNLTERRSGIELLKIIAIFMIVVSHVTQTLYTESIHYDPDYVIDIRQATYSIQQIFLTLFSYLGAQGNLIFFTCSAWFLLESKKVNLRKIFDMLADVWVISIVFLVGIGVLGGYDITFIDTINSLLPSTFATNWYITCYILFYAIHVWLNWIIEKQTQKQLLSSCVIMMCLYFGVNYIINGLFFVSPLITFVAIYFVMAYIKLYLTDFYQSVRKNMVVLMIGILGTCALTLITNYLGLRIDFFENRVSRWGGNNSPFLLMTAIALFGLFNRMDFKSRSINSISGLSLLIYIIHENILFRKYVRPQIWIYIYRSFGYEYVLLYDIVYAGVLFGITILVAMLYKLLVQRWLYEITSKVSDRIACVYGALCDWLIRIR